jgi:hypothetical protein
LPPTARIALSASSATCADQEAVAVSSRVYWNAPGQYDDGPSSDIPAMLDRLAKSVVPRRDGDAAAADEKAKAA